MMINEIIMFKRNGIFYDSKEEAIQADKDALDEFIALMVLHLNSTSPLASEELRIPLPNAERIRHYIVEHRKELSHLIRNATTTLDGYVGTYEYPTDEE